LAVSIGPTKALKEVRRVGYFSLVENVIKIDAEPRQRGRERK
jgi:hypothetical protein